MKKNILKYIILPCFSMALVFLFFPFRVFADNPTYNLTSSAFDFQLRFPSNNRVYCYNTLVNKETRIVVGISASGTGYFAIAYCNQSGWEVDSRHDYGNYCPTHPVLGANYNGSFSYNGETIYYKWIVSGSVASHSQIPVLLTDGVYYISNFSSGPSQTLQNAQNYVSYAFGPNAVDPQPPGPDYGQLIDVSFGTSIAGSGDASGNNLDCIEWNILKDSNNNDLPFDATVSIRAVPGQYTGTNKENLLTKLYSDFVLDTVNATVLDTVSASAGSYQTTWRNVANHFTWPFASVTSCLQGESYWYKNGWIYQVRLNIDDYHSEWMTIYNATSSGVENSETIINNTSITSISESVNNINNINQTTNNYYVSNSSDTTNNYYFYGSPVNPSYSGNDVSGLFPSISEILNAIRNLPSAIGQLLHDIFDDLFGIDWEYDDFEQQKQYVIANSGAFGECIGHLDDLKTLIMSYNTATQLAIIQWGDVVVDETVIVPAGMFNLSEIIAEDPMHSFYILYQSLFSGFLYTLTFIKIYREALKALRR